MKNIRFYDEFITETVLIASKDFTDIILSLEKSDNKIAKELANLIYKDIKTNYNALKTTNTNDQIEFISNNQYIKLEKELRPQDIFKKIGNKTSIGRLVRSILKDNGVSFNDSEIETFVNLYKSKYDEKSGESERIKMVSGEDIRKWYLESNYTDEFKGNTLYNSCMRYESTQRFLDIYVNNPKQCQLVIYLDDKGKLLSRALFWKVYKSSKDYEYYLDRIYYTQDSQTNLIKDWIKSKYNDKVGFYGVSPGQLTVKLDNAEFEYYPYVDSLHFMNNDEKEIYNYQHDGCDYDLQNTGGSRSSIGRYCEREDRTFPENQCVYCKRENIYMNRDNAVWSEMNDDYFWHEDAVYCKKYDDYEHKEDANFSKHLNDWLPGDKSHLVYLDDKKKESDYYDSSESKLFNEDSASGDNYLIEFLTEVDDLYYLTRNLIYVYEVEYDSKFGYIQYLTEEDMHIFGLSIKDYSKKIEDSKGRVKYVSIEQKPYQKEDYEKQFFTNINYIEFSEYLEEKGFVKTLIKLESYNKKNGPTSKNSKDKNYYYRNLLVSVYGSIYNAEERIEDDIYEFCKQELRYKLQEKNNYTDYINTLNVDLNDLIKDVSYAVREYLLSFDNSIREVYNRIGKDRYNKEHYGSIILYYTHHIVDEIEEHEKNLYMVICAIWHVLFNLK